jgi:hypothetical protein
MPSPLEPTLQTFSKHLLTIQTPHLILETSACARQPLAHNIHHTTGEPSLPRLIPASDMHALLQHLPPSCQPLIHELYVLDSNVYTPPETCYSLCYSERGQAEAAYVLRELGQVVNFSDKADALQKMLQTAACARWDLTSDEHGRFVFTSPSFSMQITTL